MTRGEEVGAYRNIKIQINEDFLRLVMASIRRPPPPFDKVNLKAICNLLTPIQSSLPHLELGKTSMRERERERANELASSKQISRIVEIYSILASRLDVAFE